jgi:hypothetical protein
MNPHLYNTHRPTNRQPIEDSFRKYQRRVPYTAERLTRFLIHISRPKIHLPCAVEDVEVQLIWCSACRGLRNPMVIQMSTRSRPEISLRGRVIDSYSSEKKRFWVTAM